MDRPVLTGRLQSRSLREPESQDAQYESNAQSVPEGQESGFSRDGTIGERSEKDADFEEDGTKLMPYLRAIHKIGFVTPKAKLAGEYSNLDVEDLDAGNQSFFNPPVTQRKTESDVGTRASGEGSGAPGDIPITDSDGEEDKPVPTKISKIGHVKTAVSSKLLGRIAAIPGEPKLTSAVGNLLKFRQGKTPLSASAQAIESVLRDRFDPIVPGITAGKYRKAVLSSLPDRSVERLPIIGKTLAGERRRVLQNAAKKLNELPYVSTIEQEKIQLSGRHEKNSVLPELKNTGMEPMGLLSEAPHVLSQKELSALTPDQKYTYRGGKAPLGAVAVGASPSVAKTYVSDLPNVAVGYALPGEHLRAYSKDQFTPGSLSNSGAHHNPFGKMNHPRFERVVTDPSAYPVPAAEYKRLHSGRLMLTRGQDVLGKPKLSAQSGYEKRAAIPGANLDSHDLPSLAIQESVSNFVSGNGPRNELVVSSVQFDSDLFSKMGQVNVVSSDRVVSDQLDTKATEAFVKQALKSGGLFRGLPRLGDVLVPPVGALTKRAHSVAFSSKALLDRCSGTSQFGSNLGSAKTAAVTFPHLLSAYGKSFHVPEVASSAFESQAGVTKLSYELQGHTKFQGLPIAVENKAGSTRQGTDADGTPWKTRMRFDYGYIESTEGADGDGVDVYIGPKKDAGSAFVVHQKNPETGEYDEDKVMLGFSNKKEAKEAFEAHYDEPEKFVGPIAEVSMKRLNELVEAKGKLVKISAASVMALLQEMSKFAFDPVLGMGPEPGGPYMGAPAPWQPYQPPPMSQMQQSQQSPLVDMAQDMRSARKTVNLARKLWAARSSIPVLI